MIQIKDPNNDYVCFECGVKYIKNKDVGQSNTFHYSECCLCIEHKPATHIRHYNYLRNENYNSRR